MRHRFNAQDATEEMAIREMVQGAIEALKDVPEGTHGMQFGFDITTALILANLLEIGVAPGEVTLARQMRDTARVHGSVRLAMNTSHAHDLARHIELGLARHECGVETPEGFTLH